MKQGKYVILIIEDDPKLLTSMEEFLQNSGFTVLKSAKGQEGLRLFYSHNHEIDLVLLDIMLPDMDGLTILHVIRECSDTPIIMTTARESEEDQVSALTNGADNYITKPFRLRVLKAHILNLIHRNLGKDGKLRFGSLEIDKTSHQVLVADRPVSLTGKEFALLVYFVENHDKVLSRDVILNNVWGYDYDGDIRTVDTLVKQLRRKLTASCPYIYSVYGLGYCFKEV